MSDTRRGRKVLRFVVTGALLGGASACGPGEPTHTMNEMAPEPEIAVNEPPEPEPETLPTMNAVAEPEPVGNEMPEPRDPEEPTAD